MLNGSHNIVKITSGFVAALFISGQMPFLAPALDNADPLFALVLALSFHLHHVEVAHQDPASGGL